MQLFKIMSKDPVRVAPETSLDEALRIMDAGFVRHLPVVGEGDRLVGLVSDRDLLEVTGWMPQEAREALAGADDPPLPERVEQVMKLHVVSASPEDTVVSAAVELVGRRIGSLPVVSEGVLVGIVTETDVVEAFVRQVESGAAVYGENPSVSRNMTQHPTTCEVDTSLSQVAQILRADQVRHLPVLRDGRLVGMVSDRDLRRAAGAGRDGSTPVEEVMSRDLRTLDFEDSLADAAALFDRYRIGAAPVLADGETVGILTVTDVLDHCLEALRETEGTEAEAG